MWFVVVPQAVKNILPALGNEFIMIIRDTSLGSTFFIGDLMTQYLVVKGATYLPIEPAGHRGRHLLHYDDVRAQQGVRPL